jgi:hemoglobin
MADNVIPINKTFEELGGRPILEKVAKIFYDKVYEDNWIGEYFKDVDQKVIEEQQVDFMSMALGGPKVYLGKLPVPAHKHMMISDELFVLREKLLDQAFVEAKACQELINRWRKIDQAFKAKIVKKSLAECEKRFKTDEIMDFPKPSSYKKSA